MIFFSVSNISVVTAAQTPSTQSSALPLCPICQGGSGAHHAFVSVKIHIHAPQKGLHMSPSASLITQHGYDYLIS